MKTQNIIIVSLVAGIVFIIVIGSAGHRKAQKELAELAVVNAPKERDEPISTVDSAKIERLINRVHIKKDDFTKTTWILPKNTSRYNEIYCYFQEGDVVAWNFRLYIKYHGDDWVFIKSYDFLIDGTRFSFTPVEVKRDNNEEVWEWSDSQIRGANESLITTLANAKSAKIRYQGEKYAEDRKITQEEIKNMKIILDLYKAMGGVFKY